MTPHYTIDPAVAWVDAEVLGEPRAEVYVVRLPDGDPLILAGPAWAIWQGVSEGGTLADIVRRTTELTGHDPALIASDVEVFVDSLVSGGLVTRGAGT